jgi:type II secretory pathway pseudopilin PulG
LLEVLVVVAIIVMLAGVGSYYVFQRYEEAKVGLAKSRCKKLAEAVTTYRVNNNDAWPGSVQDLTQTQPNGGSPLATPDEVLDPWNKPYQIDTSGEGARVFTTTPKGKVIDNISR